MDSHNVDTLSPSGSSDTVHATSLALSCGDRRTAVLLLGPSACGKSSLALRLIDQPGFGAHGKALIFASLISDDQTRLEVCDGSLVASAPDGLAGLLEVRGQGIFKLHQSASGRQIIGFAVRHRSHDELERMPEPVFTTVGGLSVRTHFIDFYGHAAAATVRTLAQLHWEQLVLDID